MNAAEELEDYVKAATVWSLGQIGRHTPEHAKAVAFANVFPKILACYMKTGGNRLIEGTAMNSQWNRDR